MPRRVRQPWLVIFTASKSMDTARFRHANNGCFLGAWLAWLKISYSHFEMVKCYISVKHSWFFLAHWYPNDSSQVEIAAVLVFAWAKLISYSQVLGFAGVVGAWRHLCWFLDPRKSYGGTQHGVRNIAEFELAWSPYLFGAFDWESIGSRKSKIRLEHFVFCLERLCWGGPVRR